MENNTTKVNILTIKEVFNIFKEMNKLFIVLICVFLSLFLMAGQVFAGDNITPSLSEAVYADLAVRGYLDNVSISLYDGNKTDTIGINDNKHWLPASTVKLFAAMYAYKQIADSKLSLYQSIPVESKNVVPTELVTDELPTIQDGDYLTIDRLLKQMITQSDNTAFNVLLDVLGRNEINDYIHSIGLTHTSIGSKLNLDTSQEQYEFDVPGYGINTTTADDYTKAFKLIWQNKISGAKPLLAVLKQQKINYMLPLLLPKDVIVAHKHGDLDPLYHDGGIIIGPKKSYVLSIFSNVGDPNLIAHLSDLIYTRNYKLVGESIQKELPMKISDQNPPLDPLLAQATLPPNVLEAKTQILTQQPITAADLGITANDLSLVQTNLQSQTIIIPADSKWHFLIPAFEFLQKAYAINNKQRSLIETQSLLLKIAEAKDLSTRGKIQQANANLQDLQDRLSILSKSSDTKNDVQAQINIQKISETRFQTLGNMLKTATGTTRNELIKEIGQQAKKAIADTLPNIPLATNATNPTQKPLIGEIIDKTNTQVTVKTSGGQEITIPLTNLSITIKEKDLLTPTPTISFNKIENLSPTLNPTPTPKPSLASAKIGSTIAIVGSSVGNTFTPTFILTNVPKELAAPEPVTVVKVNKNNHTMVISENGIPVQVNVNSQTIIKGKDTSVSFNSITAGDVIIVHGKPLSPVANPKPITSPSLTTSPTIIPIINIKSFITPIQPSKTEVAPQKPANVPVSINITQPATLPTVAQKKSSQTTPQKTNESPASSTFQSSQSQSRTTTVITITTSPNIVKPQTPQTQTQTQTQTPPQPQPKVIQSTSIQIIEKKSDAVTAPPAAPLQPAPKTSEPKKEEPKSPPQAPVQSAPASVIKDDKKK